MIFVEYISYAMVPALILVIVVAATKKKVSTYDSFVEGAQEGFEAILKIFPSMLAVVLAINLFKISGCMDLFIKLLSPIFSAINVPGELVPIGVMRSISGGGALAVLTDILQTHGPDTPIGLIASTIMGSSDTTLYVLAIYTASIGITNTKFALFVGLLCDLIAFLVATMLFA
ncbi:MAG: spore maturation protein [Clostridia bacterium]|nr:spore maturation protein [Clostridia bacterium]